MSTPLKLAALLLALTAIATPAMARDHDDHDNDRQGRHGHDRGHDDRGRDDRGDWRRDDRDDRYRHDNRRVVTVPGWRRPAYIAPRPRVYYPAPRQAYYREYPRWVRGARYNDRGYGPTYVVNDYGYYGLRQPPYGYRWRRDDRGDFLLVALASGIIADLVIHGGY